MYKNYFTIALRNFRRNKLFTLINVSGLAIGISAALVIYLIVQYEFNFDKFHPDRGQLYRVVSKIEFPDLKIQNSGVPAPTGKAVRDEVTGLDLVTHFHSTYEIKVSIPVAGSQSPVVFRKQKDIVYADEFYFSIFKYDWLAGSVQVALKDPYQVVLTESRAKSYFANTPAADIIGRQITYDDSVTATVSGVVRDFDQPTDLHFKEFISRASIENNNYLKDQFGWDQWGSINSSSQLIVKIKKGTSPASVEKQFVALREKYRSRNTEDPNSTKPDDTKHFLQAFSDIHFNAEYDAFGQRQARMPTLYGLLAVAAFLLLLGCINFINLTTAQASQRAKEIGIRKAMGSGKRQLIVQFLSETMLLTIVATILSVAITPWLLKIFGDFIPPAISFSSLNQPHVWIFLIVLILLVSLLAGFYPALVLTRFKPVTVLKNQTYQGTEQTRKAWLRKSLTVTQFVIAQFLIIATLVVSKQVHYSLSRDLGYKKDAIVIVNTPWNFFSNEKDDRRFVLMEKIRSLPGIEKLSIGGSAPASNNTSSSTMKYTEGKKILETMVETKYADTAYFNLYGMKLLAGRNLQQSDTSKEYVINETFAKFLGFKDPSEAIGHSIGEKKKMPIVGVIADFHTKSTRDPIKPLAYQAQIASSYTIHMALKPQSNNSDSWKHTLASVEKFYKEIYPEDDYKYTFFDESIANFYKTEQNISSLLRWSAGLCVFISCLGLLGLVIFITNSRTKEIGVRKILGASVVQIVTLLSKDFILLVMLAFVIALPFAWWFMHNWLQDFVYRTSLSWWLFAATGGGMIVIALLILSIRTIRSATENPVKSLRTE